MFTANSRWTTSRSSSNWSIACERKRAFSRTILACLAAAIGHGAINGFVSAAVLFSATGGNPFVGLLPVGIIGGSAFVVVAAFMLRDLHRREKEGTLDMPKAGLPDDVTKADLARAPKA